MMNKLSLEETLREQIDGLEAKIEAEVIENLQHLGDLRYYEEVHIPELQKQLADARAEIEKFNNLFANGIECFITPCEKHSGENTPPFDEFMEKYGRKCVPCLVDEIERKDKLIEQITHLCHCAGLANLSEAETLTAIRRLTCRMWDRKTERKDVLAALSAAERGEGL